MMRFAKFHTPFVSIFGALALVACADISRDELMEGGDALQGRTTPGDSDEPEDDVPSTSEDDPKEPDDLTPSPDPDPSPDAGQTEPEPEPEPEPVDEKAVFVETVLARAMQWVDIKMPYCGGPNGGTDLLCGGTCVRKGVHKTPEWDPYRTDCSGFVSWAWSLPAPGRITLWFAPYHENKSMTENTKVIRVDDLLPGDALNNRTHIILFGGWANEARTQARLLEEYDCGQVAVDRIRGISKVADTQVKVGGNNFYAIRLNSRPM